MLPVFQRVCSGNTYTPLLFESVYDAHLVLQVELVVLSVLFSFYPCGLFHSSLTPNYTYYVFLRDETFLDFRDCVLFFLVTRHLILFPAHRKCSISVCVEE